MVLRVYVEKRSGYNVEAKALLRELQTVVGIKSLQDVRIVLRYDVEGLTDDEFQQACANVLSEPQVDKLSFRRPALRAKGVMFGEEMLPGQFDQRADSASECIALLGLPRPVVRCAKLYYLLGDITEDELTRIKTYVINPVEAREASMDRPKKLVSTFEEPSDVKTLDGFISYSQEELAKLIDSLGLAMDKDDIQCCQTYFMSEGRDPSITELKMIDTYWSDHCRHTTFGTQLEDIEIDDVVVQAAWQRYQEIRKETGRSERPETLMDMATIGAKYLKQTGVVKNIDESDEINACTVHVEVEVDGHSEPWLFLFKNETHNHPTEIEPFGGAATCIGGAIRDPLSGRAYVYQAMRITGAADPTKPIEDTLPGKLPQRKIVKTAAAGYSSYGNQIGLATGEVHEIYHPGYVAKRMEVGAVVAAAPKDHVRRECPRAGDVIVLVGGRTGRDGIGGATGSSKAHTEDSIATNGAEVQKGNAVCERKLQRLFKRKDVCRLILRCNDFGAGGVSVAIGELADGLEINLDKVPKKYEGLDGTELAISESQERMAVALDAADVKKFLAIAKEENLEATVVATVTADPRLVMKWRGKTICDISRAFLNTNGAKKFQKVTVSKQEAYVHEVAGTSLRERLDTLVSDLNVASQKGLSEMFDSTIGAATILAPFGGKKQLTKPMAMVASLPVAPGSATSTVSAMSWGYNPYLMEKNQYVGAYAAVLESLSKLVAAGFSLDAAYLSFQEYFERLGADPKRWGKPAAALLGALSAQLDFGVAAIGGKDSMSGSFEDLDVPPTLISFAVATGNVKDVLSPELKAAGHDIYWICPKKAEGELLPPAAAAKRAQKLLLEHAENGDILAAATPGYGGAAEGLFNMCLGNQIGVELADNVALDELFGLSYGSFLVEMRPASYLELDDSEADFIYLGKTSEAYTLSYQGDVIDLSEVQELWEKPLHDVFPYKQQGEAVEQLSFSQRARSKASRVLDFGKPEVVIPIFPGNNCEFDSERAFLAAGATVTPVLINNLTPEDIASSVDRVAKAISKANIIMIPGGFSGGDEPDGSAKFITAFFRNPKLTEAVRTHLNERDGLMLGICNGFQALVKLGLVPYGDIVEPTEDAPTLTFNTIARHQSGLVRTRVASILSPWYANAQVGDMHTIAISHGEGRFIAPEAVLSDLAAKGQIATQYVDEAGIPSMDLSVNPNGSMLAIEGICSPDGRVLGKMGHSERTGDYTFKNVPGVTIEPIFAAGVAYFSE